MSSDQHPRSVDLHDPDVLAGHAELVTRDTVIGLEATVERLERELAVAQRRIRRLRRRLRSREQQVAGQSARRRPLLLRLVRRVARARAAR